MRALTKEDAHALETLIDQAGLSEVLNMAAGICAEKADHIRSNWQDRLLAKVWDGFGQRLSDMGDDAEREGC